MGGWPGTKAVISCGASRNNQSFMQAQKRAFPDPEQNFNLGLKTATLGGYPYQMSPFMMLQMYTSLFTQNRNLQLHVLPARNAAQPWQVDSSWQGNDAFNRFLAACIFKGMNDVIYGGSGTGHGLGGLRGRIPAFIFMQRQARSMNRDPARRTREG